jgi:hypothetical protein
MDSEISIFSFSIENSFIYPPSKGNIENISIHQLNRIGDNFTFNNINYYPIDNSAP